MVYCAQAFIRRLGQPNGLNPSTCAWAHVSPATRRTAWSSISAVDVTPPCFMFAFANVGLSETLLWGSTHVSSLNDGLLEYMTRQMDRTFDVFSSSSLRYKWSSRRA
eukprot:gb/GEZN01011103.1/.p3 GENE.gb/GEZN01011103.1/~~gb/GEZN01011103.1/.p3  ORF type:complete len:107 (-),score=0.38 gb/GEZN01011103.1/:559-879(-)